MSKPIVRRRLVELVLMVALATAVLFVPTTPGVAQTPPCGRTLVRNPWEGNARVWIWTYQNCYRRIKYKKVIVGHGSDSPCFTIPPGASQTFTVVETLSLFGHYDWYDHQANC
jgi:hypothetical protein